VAWSSDYAFDGPSHFGLEGYIQSVEITVLRDGAGYRFLARHLYESGDRLEFVEIPVSSLGLSGPGVSLLDVSEDEPWVVFQPSSDGFVSFSFSTGGTPLSVRFNITHAVARNHTGDDNRFELVVWRDRSDERRSVYGRMTPDSSYRPYLNSDPIDTDIGLYKWHIRRVVCANDYQKSVHVTHLAAEVRVRVPF
jgi:hypothetical protein